MPVVLADHNPAWESEGESTLAVAAPSWAQREYHDLGPQEIEVKVFPIVLGMFSCKGCRQIALKSVCHPAIISVRGSIHFPASSPIPNIGKVFTFPHITDEKYFLAFFSIY